MATRSYTWGETAAGRLATSLILLIVSTLTNAQINGTLSNALNLSATAVDLGLPEGLAVLVKGEQNTVEVVWEPAANTIGTASIALLLTLQLSGEQIAYREVGRDEKEGRVTLSGIQLGKDYSLTVFSTNGSLNSSEVITFNIEPGSSDAFACPYLEVFLTILSMVLLAVVAAACLIVCIVCVQSRGWRRVKDSSRNKTGTVTPKPPSPAKGKRRHRKSTGSHRSNRTIGSISTAVAPGGQPASLTLDAINYSSSHAYDSLEYNAYPDFALEENPAYNTHGQAHNDGEDPYIEANPAYNLFTGQVQKGSLHHQKIMAETDFVPLEANPAYNLPIPAHTDDLSPPLQSNPAYGLHPGETMMQYSDPVMQDNPAYICTIQSPGLHADYSAGDSPGESLYDVCESQSAAATNDDITLEDNPTYNYVPNTGPSFLSSNTQPQMYQLSDVNIDHDSNSIPLQDNPSYSSASHLQGASSNLSPHLLNTEQGGNHGNTMLPLHM